MEKAFPLIVVIKLVPTADSCYFSTLLPMTGHDDEALREERGKKE